MTKLPSRRKSPSFQDFRVEKADTLLPFLINTLHNKSRSAVKSYLAHRQIAVNGKCFTAFDTPLQKGDIVRLSAVGEERPNPNHKCRVVYEDDDILVVEKKHGVLTAGVDTERTVYTIMTEHVRRRRSDNRLYVVHRLERDISGLVLFAKNELTQERLLHIWQENRIVRTFVAIVEGSFEKGKGQVTSFLKDNRAALRMISAPVDNGGKKAITNYRLLQKGEHYSLVELELVSDVKHQLRVHLSDLGYPIAGDKKYAAQTNPLKRLSLHARSLKFMHPTTRENMNFDTGIPAQFQ